MPANVNADSRTPTPVGVNRLVQYGLLAVVAATVANSAIRVAAIAVLDIPPGFLPLRGFTIGTIQAGWSPVALLSTVGAVGGTIVYGLLTRRSRRPNRTFKLVAAVVLLLSFGGFLPLLPLVSGMPYAAFATLAVMHVTAATIIVGVLTRAPAADGR